MVTLRSCHVIKTLENDNTLKHWLIRSCELRIISIMYIFVSISLVHDNYNLKLHKYICITTYKPDIKSNPNPTTKQHAAVSIQLNKVTCPTYLDKFIRDVLFHHCFDFRLGLSCCRISLALVYKQNTAFGMRSPTSNEA